MVRTSVFISSGKIHKDYSVEGVKKFIRSISTKIKKYNDKLIVLYPDIFDGFGLGHAQEELVSLGRAMKKRNLRCCSVFNNQSVRNIGALISSHAEFYDLAKLSFENRILIRPGECSDSRDLIFKKEMNSIPGYIVNRISIIEESNKSAMEVAKLKNMPWVFDMSDNTGDIDNCKNSWANFRLQRNILPIFLCKSEEDVPNTKFDFDALIVERP